MKFEVLSNEKLVWNISSIEDKDGVSIFSVSLKYSNKVKPKAVEIKWRERMKDIYSTWNPTAEGKHWIRQWWDPNVSSSCFYSGAPILSTINHKGDNILTVALSDAKKPNKLSFCVQDIMEQEEVEYCVTLFAEEIEAIEEYQTFLRIDRRTISFVDAVESVREWWRTQLDTNDYVPSSAEDALYSTWYNFHQQPKQDILLEELKIASKIGLKTVIIDDGWQFSGLGDGTYVNCGDWEVSKDKFYDFKGFVEALHSLPMKVMIWFSVPYVGFNTEAYKKFSDKLLYQDYSDQRLTGVLDVRYKEVRQHLVDTYLNFSKKYDLDGLKLDFIDSFYVTKDTPPYNENMDCLTVEEAVCQLLKDVSKSLKTYKEDFLIEFRQKYIGPEIVKYCNMLRVCDCAYDSVTNRIGTIDLRLLSADTAIHADMLLWGKDELIENCGVQLLNIMFSVPQISVLLTNSTEDQLRLLKNYLNYWEQNKEILLHGKLTVSNPEINYSEISSEDNNKKITVLYTKNVVTYTGKPLDLFNATNMEFVCIENDTGKKLRVIVKDCFGSVMTEQDVNSKDLVKISVPVAGSCEIR